MSELDVTVREIPGTRAIEVRLPLKMVLPLPWPEFNRRAREYAAELRMKSRVKRMEAKS